MIFLLLTIFVSIGIFLVFKLAGRSGLNPLPFVCVNYFVAIVSGLIFTPVDFTLFKQFPIQLYANAFLIGVLFMLMFLVVHRSTNKVGLGITSAASKLAVALPVFVSLIIDENDHFYVKKIIGIIILLVAFVLIVFPKKQNHNRNKALIYPVILFFGMGASDALIKYAQQYYIPSGAVSNFTLLVFTISAITGIVILGITNQVDNVLKTKNILYGMILGLCNYGSLYFMIRALNLNLNRAIFLDSSRIFIINSLGIILIATLIGRLFFKERLLIINYIGLISALAGFFLIV